MSLQCRQPEYSLPCIPGLMQRDAGCEDDTVASPLQQISPQTKQNVSKHPLFHGPRPHSQAVDGNTDGLCSPKSQAFYERSSKSATGAGWAGAATTAAAAACSCRTSCAAFSRSAASSATKETLEPASVKSIRSLTVDWLEEAAAPVVAGALATAHSASKSRRSATTGAVSAWPAAASHTTDLGESCEPSVCRACASSSFFGASSSALSATSLFSSSCSFLFLFFFGLQTTVSSPGSCLVSSMTTSSGSNCGAEQDAKSEPTCASASATACSTAMRSALRAQGQCPQCPRRRCQHHPAKGIGEVGSDRYSCACGCSSAGAAPSPTR
eukprot:TRINITY_DN14462_c0_g1_i5.p1 TRINITY_DN14462_c0_g1~~TRINITY_DN14462_c0_g1_i5.p1  ORF type:complete len:326 (+),score=13.89 TRINITY_DN14462_c0_g1_i5:29-1006(+)